MRIIFAGTPDFAAMHLQALLDSDADVVAVYTQPDRPAGRGRQLTASSVKQLALEHGLQVLQPASLKTAESQAELGALNADVMVVVAYGLILPADVLAMPTYGCLNVHASLLPRWRGAAPIQRAIEAGDAQTGVTIMQMDVGLDTGDMLAVETVDITSATTSASLHNELAQAGAKQLLEVLADLSARQTQAIAQDDTAAVYAEKLSKSEAWIDWQTPVQAIHRKIQAFNPWPVAQTLFNDKRLRIFAADVLCDSVPHTMPGHLNAEGIVAAFGGRLQLQEVQLEGGKRMAIADFLRSRDVAGVVLTSPEAR